MQQVTEMYFAVVGTMCPIGCRTQTREEQPVSYTANIALQLLN